MSLSAMVRTSFVLSGLLGLRFEGLPDGNGGFTSLEAAIPIQVGCANQTQSVQLTSTVGNSRTNAITQSPNNQRNPKRVQQTSNSNQYLPPPPGTPSNQLSPPSIDNSINNFSSSPLHCGHFNCKEHEMCVTWTKFDEKGNHSPKFRRSKSNGFEEINSVKECLFDDGFYHPKVNPKLSQLCPRGKTHAILHESRPCLRDEPPCPLIWKYKCVEESASPHDCSLKKCPSGGCVEQIVCGSQPPCMLDAVCT